MTARRASIVAALVVGACGGGAPIVDEDLSVRVVTDVREVEFGRSFPLTVVREWKKDLAPEEWSDQSLAPLVVRTVETTRREDDRHVEETRLCRAYAFSLTDVTVPALAFTATPKGGGAPRVASAAALHVRVRPALDPKAPGPAELPGDLPSAPFPWIRWSTVGAAALVASTWLIRRRLSRRLAPADSSAAAPAAPLAPPPAPSERALLRIDRLRQRPRGARADVESFYVEASTIVREYVAERFAVGAPETTSEELVAKSLTATALAAPHRALLADILSRCDLVKFACDAPTADDHDRLLATAETFVRETADGARR